MRPSAGGDALPSTKPRSRKSSVADPSHHNPSSNVPTAFFLRSEGDMEQSMSSSQDTESASKPRDSTFGVQSLADTLEAAFGRDNGSTAGERTASFEGSDGNKRQNSRSCSNTSSQRSANPSESPPSSPSRRRKRNLSNQTISSSISPLNTDARSPLPNSAMPSTPKSLSLHSLKLGDEDFTLDEVASQAITSSGEEEDEDDTQQGELSSFPQLVMPSIQMPTRRPFTNKGKSMGKLKILIAGEAGIGKSSLIRSIVQLCDDIVHVDPLCLSRSMSQSQLAETLSRKKRSESAVYARISETHASTKPYPEWYTEVEESRVLRRRKSSKSTADAVLERNICFVDTPGFGQGTSRTADMNTVVDYVESLLYQSASVTSMEDSDVLGVFSGNGGISVDVVIYLLPPCQDISKDVDFMQRLSAVTNVIPVIAKSDTLSFAEIIAVKTSILARLQSTEIKPFFFGKALEDALLAVQGLSLGHSSSTETRSMNPDMSGLSQYPFTIPTYPYTISSAPGPDSENMDASLLMSPDYVQPLFSSELATLINQIFDPESIAWLRHCAAKKFVAWRNRTRLSGDSFILQTLQQQQQPRSPISASVGLNGAALNTSTASSIFSAASPSGVLVPRTGSPFYPSNSELQSPFLASSPSLANSDRLDHPTDFSLARYNNHAQGDQKFSEIRLAKWATDLQRSLRNERDRFEELQRNERARWLLERVGEEVARGNIVSSPGGSPRADWAVVRRNNEKQVGQVGLRYGNARSLDSRDPLGLCDFSDEVRRRGYIFVKVLGGVSVLGAVVVAVVRACGVETGLPEGGIWNWITGGKE